MSWNPVLNKFIEIKQAFIKKYGKDILFDYNPDEESCLEYWVRKLNNKDYMELIKLLQLVEYEDFLLIRYANFTSLFNEGVDRTFDDFWKVYDGFYMECRSVALNIKKDELVLTPFRKFRNLNECEENSLENIREMIKNAQSVEISNKLDGSMQSARYYNGQIIMSGSQSLNPDNSWRLKDGYRMLKENSAYSRMLKDFPNYTFIFEYISLKDAHVVKYKKEQEGLYLIGIRDTNTGYEHSYANILRIASKYNIPTTEVFNTTLDEIVNNLDKKKSDEAEGFVLNIDGYKVKIKYDDYVLMHRLLGTISSPNVIIKSIADGNFDDLLSKVPDSYKDRVMKIAQTVFDYVNNTEKEAEFLYQEALNYSSGDKKEFMCWVNKNVPKEIMHYVRCKYDGTKYNILNPRPLQYKKLNEMGIDIRSLFNKDKDNDEYERD